MRTPAPLWFLTGLLFGLALSPMSDEFASRMKNEPTPAVQPAPPDLVMGLAELAADEHRARVNAEQTLDEFKQHAKSVVEKLLVEIQRLQKRPTLKKGSIGT